MNVNIPPARGELRRVGDSRAGRGTRVAYDRCVVRMGVCVVKENVRLTIVCAFVVM
jgi:hypothetical protein